MRKGKMRLFTRYRFIQIIVVVAIIVFLELTSFSQDKPIIKKTDGEYTIILSEVMKKTLRNYDPDFIPWKQKDYLPTLVKDYSFSTKQVPFAVIGDFNGDGTLDVVLQGHNSSNALLVCILSDGKSFKVVEITRSGIINPKEEWYGMGDYNEYGLWTYLTFVLPRTIDSAFEDRPLKLKTAAFELNYFEKASVLYYFKNGKFFTYTTGD